MAKLPEYLVANTNILPNDQQPNIHRVPFELPCQQQISSQTNDEDNSDDDENNDDDDDDDDNDDDDDEQDDPETIILNRPPAEMIKLQPLPPAASIKKGEDVF